MGTTAGVGRQLERPELARGTVAQRIQAIILSGVDALEVEFAGTGDVRIDEGLLLAHLPLAAIDTAAYLGAVATAPDGHHHESGGQVLQVAQVQVEGVDAGDVDGHLAVGVETDALATYLITGIVEVEHEIVTGCTLLLQG